MNITIKKLESQYKTLCNAIVERFAEKQELEFDGWVADEVGSIACFSEQYFFSIDEICLDLFPEQPKGLILNWLNDSVEYCTKIEAKRINYKSYALGLRYDKL